MFKCFFLPSFFFVFAIVNFGVSGFVDSARGNMFQNPNYKNPKGNVKKSGNKDSKTRLDTKNHKKNMNKNIPRVAKSPLNEHIGKNQLRNKENLVERQGDDFEQLVLYYYIAVSFLLYNYKKVDPTIFSKLGDKPYKGPVDEDVFAVYKEFSGSDSKGMSTYHDYLSRFCGDALKKILGLTDKKSKISYSDAYTKMYDKIKNFLLQVEKIDINLKGEGWKDESVQWAFTVALQVFAYKKIYEHLNKNISSLGENNHDPALQHDLVYVKFLSEMMYNIFKNVLFSLDAGNIIRSRDLFFLRGLKLKNIGPESPRNMFYSAFSNLVFRPAELKGSVRMFLDCFYPIIDRIKRIK